MEKIIRLISLALAITVFLFTFASCGAPGDDISDHNEIDTSDMETDGKTPKEDDSADKETENQTPETADPKETEDRPEDTDNSPETEWLNPPETDKQPTDTTAPVETEILPPDTTDATETEKTPDDTTSPPDTEKTPDETTNTPETDTQPTETTAPDAPQESDGTSPEMLIESGYTVSETTNFNILVTEDKVKTSRTARVAALQNESGENALYLDVLTEDGQVMTSITWKGYYQMFVREDGLIMLMRLWMSPVTQRCTGIYQFFDVSDSKLSGYDVVELEIPEINAVPGEGKTINFAVRSPSEAARYELTFTDFIYSYQAEFDEDTLDGKSIYLIADSYLNPDKPVVYSDADKVEFPNLEDKEIADKYTWEYASALFE